MASELVWERLQEPDAKRPMYRTTDHRFFLFTDSGKRSWQLVDYGGGAVEVIDEGITVAEGKRMAQEIIDPRIREALDG